MDGAIALVLVAIEQWLFATFSPEKK